MNGKNLNTKAGVWLVAAVIVGVGGRVGAQETPSGDRELLRLVAKQAKANRESLTTWTGAVEVDIRSSSRDAGQERNQHTRYKVTFAYDGAGKKYCFHASQSKPINLRWGAIRTKDGYYSASPWADERMKNAAGLLVKGSDRPTFTIDPHRVEQRGDFSPDFDPFYLMEMEGDEIHHRLMFVYDNWNTKGMPLLTVKRDRNLVALVIERPKVTRNNYVFDLDQGANLVSMSNDSSSIAVKVDHSREFVNVGGVWVPKTTTARNVNSGQPSKRYECKLSWSEHVLNQPVPSDSFRPEAVGVQKGDVVRNTLTDTEFEYDEGGLPEVRPNPRLRLVLNVAAALAVVAALAAVAARLARRRKPREAGHDPVA